MVTAFRFLQAIQDSDDYLEMHRGMETFGDVDVSYKLSICLLPAMCMARSVLTYMILIRNVFLRQRSTSPQMSFAKIW